MATQTAKFPAFDQSVYADLDEFSELEADWDEQGAYPIDPAIIASARSLLQSLEGTVTQPNVAPTSSGSIQFEWLWGKTKQRLGLYFVQQNSIRYLKWHPRQDVKETGIIASSDEIAIVELHDWFMEGAGQS